MIKFLYKLLLFWGIIYVVLLFTSKYDNYRCDLSNPSIYRIKNSIKFTNLHILFVGGSYTYASIIPSIFDSAGLKTYNLGMPAAGPFIYELLIDNYLSAVKSKPKFLFLSISPMTFTDACDDWYEYAVHRYLTNPVSNEKILLENKNIRKYFRLLVKSSLTGIKNISQSLCNASHSKPDDMFIDSKGFQPSENVINDSEMFHSPNPYPEMLGYSFSDKKYNKLLELVKKYELMGIKIVFHETPSFHINRCFTHELLSTYNDKIKLLGEKHTLFYCRNISSYPVKYFRNPDHLNTAGAIKFTDFLLQMCQSRINIFE